MPFIVCLTFGLLIEFAAGVHQKEWSALSNANLTMALLALVTALFGLMLCLEFASPTGHLDLLVGTVAVFFAAVAISALARAPALGM